MNELEIIIIDNDEARREELKRLIEKYGVEVGIHPVTCRKEVFINETDDHNKPGEHDLSSKNQIKWENEWEEDLFDIERFDLIFLHIGKNKFNSKFYELRCEKKGLSNRVFGYTGDQPLYWYGNSHYLKKIGTGAGAAKSFHFKDFFEDWLSNEQQNKERFGVPWNFHKLKGKDFKYLPAVSILCQGYLGVFAESGKNESDQVVKKALEKMGWHLLEDVLPGAKTTWQLGRKSNPDENVEEPAWFRDIFEKSEMERYNLVQAIRNEWGNGHEEDLETVIKLIDAIYDDDSSNYTPITVAGAYLAVAKKTGE